MNEAASIGDVLDGLRFLQPPASVHVQIRTPAKVGLLARSQMKDLIAFGHSLGLDVVDWHPGGGWLVQRGYLVIRGRWDAVERFLEALLAAAVAASGRLGT